MWILLKQETVSEWQWHQLGHMQVCTSLQTDNHTSTPPLSFLLARCPSCRPTNSVKALKAAVDQYLLPTGPRQQTCSSGFAAVCPYCERLMKGQMGGHHTISCSLLCILCGQCEKWCFAKCQFVFVILNAMGICFVFCI